MRLCVRMHCYVAFVDMLTTYVDILEVMSSIYSVRWRANNVRTRVRKSIDRDFDRDFDVSRPMLIENKHKQRKLTNVIENNN